MIRFDLNMEYDEVYGKFVFVQFCIFTKNLLIAKEIDSASLFTRGIIKNIISQ